MFDMSCIIAIVERGKAQVIVDAAKEVGASGATIFYGRGTGESEVKRFLNVQIEASKEVIMILSGKDELRTVVEAMVDAGDLEDPGRGIIFTVPVTNLLGFNHRDEFIE